MHKGQWKERGGKRSGGGVERGYGVMWGWKGAARSRGTVVRAGGRKCDKQESPSASADSCFRARGGGGERIKAAGTAVTAGKRKQSM